MQWENHWLRHIRLGETVLTVKDEYWKDGRERRYVLFLNNDYDYFETVVEDGLLKEKTSLFLLPDFILGNNPVKTTVQFQLEVKQRITMPRQGLARRCMTEVAVQIEANRGKDSYFYYGFTTLRKSEKLYDFYT